MFKKSKPCCVLTCKIENIKMQKIKMIFGLSVVAAATFLALMKAKKYMNYIDEKYTDEDSNKKKVDYCKS